MTIEEIEAALRAVPLIVWVGEVRTANEAKEWVGPVETQEPDYPAMARAVAEAWGEVEGALRELYALIEEGWLVRNTTNDGHMPSFLQESARLVNALKAAQDALAAAHLPAQDERDVPMDYAPPLVAQGGPLPSRKRYRMKEPEVLAEPAPHGGWLVWPIDRPGCHHMTDETFAQTYEPVERRERDPDAHGGL